MSNEAKKEARAARFGLPTAASKIGGLVNTNIDVLKKRAERFGTTLPGSILESVSDSLSSIIRNSSQKPSKSHRNNNIFRLKSKRKEKNEKKDLVKLKKFHP